MWVVEKIRVSVERTNLPLPVAEYSFKIADIMFGDKTACGKSKRASLCPNIITPDTIPEFCIPSRVTALQDPGRPATAAPHPHPLPRGEASAGELGSSHIIQVESVDDGPSESGFSDEESTNADPQSQAALSLPHLAKAQTCYGFCTLLESPNTRRKESIFHSDPASCSTPLLVPRSRSNTCSRSSLPPSPSSPSFSLHAFSSRLSHRGLPLSRQGTLDSDTTSSAESSPFSSPLLARSPPRSSLFKALSHEKLLSRGARKTAVSRNNSLSTDEGSSTDSSPNVLRRASADLLEPPPCGSRLAPPAIFPMDLVPYRDRVLRENRVPLGQDGTLRLSAEYCPENQRLRVRLISAEGLYAPGVDPKGINCSVSVAMAPGKAQKQRSTVIRKSRNPIFNEDFFFDGVSEDDLCFRTLHFKVVNKMSAMKRDYTLGDCEVPLTSILSM
ncbi:C2 calcium-dependent domain-containing protein 4C-like [Anguilla anguilla]|uniref:C2 calcium-dependent domain-containing protein 4C-like n=1 Tax=Anguilla anguilla TaxID=7936 RepID=UPI0015AFE076|nr:C2 calcium-dependent domain-containing protein 4C-like [Anguilla anguilla]